MTEGWSYGQLSALAERIAALGSSMDRYLDSGPPGGYLSTLTKNQIAELGFMNTHGIYAMVCCGPQNLGSKCIYWSEFFSICAATMEREAAIAKRDLEAAENRDKCQCSECACRDHAKDAAATA